MSSTAALDDSLQALAALCFSGDGTGMCRYLDWLFEGVEIAGKDVIDIGGWSGCLALDSRKHQAPRTSLDCWHEAGSRRSRSGGVRTGDTGELGGGSPNAAAAYVLTSHFRLHVRP